MFVSARQNYYFCLMKKTIMTLFAGLILAACAQKPSGDVAIVAHRGFWNCEDGGFSHNSIASLKAAQNNGFWGSEFDVHMTADEVLIIFHDHTIDGKTIDSTRFSEFDYYRLPNGEKIPTLDEYIAQFKAGPECVMVFEVKEHSNADLENRCIELAIDKLKAAEMLSPEKVIFISFSMNACKTIAARLPGFTVQYLESDLNPKSVWNHGINGMDQHYSVFTSKPHYVKECKDLGMSVNVWTVNDEERINRMIELGVDQITTNEPLLVRDLIVKAGKKELK